jgi:predicted ATPase
MIEQQIKRLSTAERRVLEAASVAGVEFSVAAVAAGLQVGVEQVEEWCADLARRGHFLRARGEDAWPDHTLATRYGFIHTLYQQVFYNRLPPGRRAHLHQRISQWSEAVYVGPVYYY